MGGGGGAQSFIERASNQIMKEKDDEIEKQLGKMSESIERVE